MNGGLPSAPNASCGGRMALRRPPYGTTAGVSREAGAGRQVPRNAIALFVGHGMHSRVGNRSRYLAAGSFLLILLPVPTAHLVDSYGTSRTAPKPCSSLHAVELASVITRAGLPSPTVLRIARHTLARISGRILHVPKAPLSYAQNKILSG